MGMAGMLLVAKTDGTVPGHDGHTMASSPQAKTSEKTSAHEGH